MKPPELIRKRQSSSTFARSCWARRVCLATWTTVALLPAFASDPGEPAALPDSAVHVERTDVRGGGELYTYFYQAPDDRGGYTEFPMVSVLRDTLGDNDPTNDRLRDVWSLTYIRPGIWHRITAAIPFFYHHGGPMHVSASSIPPPILDLAAPARGTPSKLAGALVQATVLDPLGSSFRSPSRSYRGRIGEYRSMQAWRALDVLDSAQGEQDALSSDELERVEGRLFLSTRLLGGLVDRRFLPVVWEKQREQSSDDTGHNWELLRQQAEADGLWFQPLDLGGGTPRFAMLWVEQSAAVHPPAHHRFDSQFLAISDPFGDTRIAKWKGYTETWPLNPGADSHPVPSRMVPLALYSLDHPRVPLLLVDFRDPSKPRRREMLKRASDDIATGVLGFTGLSHWRYLIMKTTWFFVHRRHGGAFDRDARVRAYVALCNALPVDRSLNPRLRDELEHRIDELGFNPLQDSCRDAPRIARRQYAALTEAAESGRLERELERGRSAEAARLMHGTAARVMLSLASISTLGLYRHHEPETPKMLALIDQQRRFTWHKRYLEAVLHAGPDPEVAANMSEVRESIHEMTHLALARRSDRTAAAEIVYQLLSRTSDRAVRLECVECLRQLNRADAEAAVVSAFAPSPEPQALPTIGQ
jgi:hypothetical protein